jgi:hypothetical protein
VRLAAEIIAFTLLGIAVFRVFYLPYRIGKTYKWEAADVWMSTVTAVALAVVAYEVSR